MKKLWAVMLAAAMILSSSVTAFAENSDTSSNTIFGQARYAYLYTASSILSNNGTTATCTSSATGATSITKITATQYLEKRTWLSSEMKWVWVCIDYWSTSVDSNILPSMANSKYDLSSGTYRLRTVFELYVGNSSKPAETVEAKSNEIII